MRDKLIELIDNNKACPFDNLECSECEYYDITPCFAGRMADVLIANGVTFVGVPDNIVGDKKPVLYNVIRGALCPKCDGELDLKVVYKRLPKLRN